MIVTTTNNIDGRQIQDYLGLVFGEVVTGVDFVRDIGAGFRDFFGGRSKSYESELIEAREAAISEMKLRAGDLGADAVVGCKVDYEILGASNGMLMVTISGTAVKFTN